MIIRLSSVAGNFFVILKTFDTNIVISHSVGRARTSDGLANSFVMTVYENIFQS